MGVVKNAPSGGGGCPSGQKAKTSPKSRIINKSTGAARPSNSGRGFQIPTHQNLVASKAEEASAALAFPPLQKKSPSLKNSTRRRTRTLENHDSSRTLGVRLPHLPWITIVFPHPWRRKTPLILNNKHFN